MKRLTQIQMQKTQGGFCWFAALYLGFMVGFIAALVVTAVNPPKI